MKKVICSVALAAVLIFAAIIPGAAADKKSVRLCFIVDSGSIVGCADGTSLLDAVLGAVSKSGERVAFFFDDADMSYGGDYASAMMKVFSSGMPVGVYDTRIGDGADRLGEALLYQKYITRSSSRTVLTTSAQSRGFSGEYAVFTVDILISNPELIDARSLSNFRDTTMVVRIAPEFVPHVVSLFNSIKTSGIYIITPTETGFSSFGTEG